VTTIHNKETYERGGLCEERGNAVVVHRTMVTEKVKDRRRGGLDGAAGVTIIHNKETYERGGLCEERGNR
jgi:hypothetical protein